ncbi:endospore germination permease [Polycladomyces sp. WAk]|uniref:Endospore germination permease n=1 Tax=Polycladomyces zharkentensis TaxID=2807616 RepID=A0ABS2WFH9_9BACL|nr:endospore germination permease [Polycladomyces sp. WAk]MBN2908298.1 endospore germination permease [Polycladomyces sp. WAk]
MAGNRNKEEIRSINPHQARAILTATMVGVGVLTLPRSVAIPLKTGGVWAVLVAGVLNAVPIYLITVLGRMFPGQTLVQYISQVVGFKNRPGLSKMISFLFVLPLGLFLLLSISIVTRYFAEVVKTAVLINTPIEVTMITLLFTAAVVASNHLGVIARLSELLLLILYMPGLLLIFAGIQEGSIENLMPLFSFSGRELVQGVLASSYSFQGYIVALIFMGYYQQPKKSLRPHMISISVVTLGYAVTVLVTLATLGSFEAIRIMWPTLEVFKLTEFPGDIFERIESAVLAVWVVAVFTTVKNLYGAVVDIMMRYANCRERFRPWISFAVVPIAYLLGMWPNNVFDVFRFSDIIGSYGLILSFAIPILLLLIAWLRRLGSRREQMQT